MEPKRCQKVGKELKNSASRLPSQSAFPNRATLLKKLAIIGKNVPEPVVAPYCPKLGGGGGGATPCNQKTTSL